MINIIITFICFVKLLSHSSNLRLGLTVSYKVIFGSKNGHVDSKTSHTQIRFQPQLSLGRLLEQRQWTMQLHLYQNSGFEFSNKFDNSKQTKRGLVYSPNLCFPKTSLRNPNQFHKLLLPSFISDIMCNGCGTSLSRRLN